MNDRIDALRSRFDGVVVPRIWVTLALSVLVHVAVLLISPKHPIKPPEAGDDPNSRIPLTLRLNLPPSPPSAAVAPPRAAPRPPLQAPRPKAAPRPQPAPPVIAQKKPAPDTQAPVPVTPPAPARPPAEGDLASYIEARRRARGDPVPAAPAEDSDARSKRIIDSNLGSTRERAFGYDPRKGGGMFHIERVDSDYAEFIFYGWNNNISRNTKQLIEVRRGSNSDIRIAVVRKMIAIIRENTQEDFLWVSARLGRSLMLSARPRDNAGLEDFMMREFFYETGAAQR